ncbi:hypothetical protein DCC81_08920 [Chitinophaga parva]|uniref:Uncharacterized protein n=1 Tax=Chitinophaga parva TaxID=2169414 RepID=A0A2T7BPG1_9BACT|nr:hypothetical protein DCC81_08920 [Chitinophaga parva]
MQGFFPAHHGKQPNDHIVSGFVFIQDAKEVVQLLKAQVGQLFKVACFSRELRVFGTGDQEKIAEAGFVLFEFKVD